MSREKAIETCNNLIITLNRIGKIKQSSERFYYGEENVDDCKSTVTKKDLLKKINQIKLRFDIKTKELIPHNFGKYIN